MFLYPICSSLASEFFLNCQFSCWIWRELIQSLYQPGCLYRTSLGGRIPQILSLQEKVDFSKARPESLVDVPTLQHQIVEITVAVPGSWQGWRSFVVKRSQELGVSQVLVGPDTGKVQYLPQQDSIGPDIWLGGVAMLQILKFENIKQY